MLEHRSADCHTKGAKTVWQLAYAGLHRLAGVAGPARSETLDRGSVNQKPRRNLVFPDRLARAHSTVCDRRYLPFPFSDERSARARYSTLPRSVVNVKAYA